jgi:uncharacterized membrane protein YeaQ/YmgE (transglycosylase-associated protein family)
MDAMSILGNTILGAAGGWLGDKLKKNGLGTIGNLIAGVAGGNILPILLSALGLVANANSFDEGGGVNIVGMIISLLGGSAGSLLGGLFKKAE